MVVVVYRNNCVSFLYCRQGVDFVQCVFLGFVLGQMVVNRDGAAICYSVMVWGCEEDFRNGEGVFVEEFVIIQMLGEFL